MNPPQPLSCKEVVELITAYLEQALLAETQAQMEAHLGECPGCAAYLRQIQKTISMLRLISQEAVFPETAHDLLSIFEQWKKGQLAT